MLFFAWHSDQAVVVSFFAIGVKLRLRDQIASRFSASRRNRMHEPISIP